MHKCLIVTHKNSVRNMGNMKRIFKHFDKYDVGVRNQFKVITSGRESEYGNQNNVPYQIRIY